MASNLELQEAEDCIDRLNELNAALEAENERLTKERDGAIECWTELWKDTPEAAERALAERAGGVRAEDAREALRELANVKMDLSLEDWCRISNTILAALTTEPDAPEGRREAVRIGDAVLEWMVKFDLLDGGNEYYVADVLAVLNDLTPSTRPSEHAVTDEMVEAASEAIQKFRRTPEQDASGKRYYRIFARSVLEAALAQKEEGR